MHSCAHCGKDVEGARDMSRKETCPSCSADLHVCLNCRFYSDTSHNKCTEPKSDFQRSRDKANFCDYFQYKEGPAGGGASPDVKDSAKKFFDDLFK